MKSENVRIRIAPCAGYGLFLSLFGVFIGGINRNCFGAEASYQLAQEYASVFTLFQVCTLFLCALHASLRPPSSSAQTTGDTDARSATHAGACATSRRETTATKSLAPAMFALLMVAGIYILAVSSLVDASNAGETAATGGEGPATWLLWISAALTGCASSGSFLSWIEVLHAIDDERGLVRTIVAGTLISSILDVVMAMVAGVAASLAVVGAFALAHLALLMFCQLKVSAGPARPESPGETEGGAAARPHGFVGSLKTLGPIWRPVICIGVIGFSGGVARAMSLEVDPNAELMRAMFPIGYFASSLLAGVSSRCGIGFRSDRLYIALLIASSTAFLVVPLFGDTYLAVLSGIENAVFSIASICMVAMSLLLAREKGVGCVPVAAIVLGTVYGCVGLGQLFGSFFAYSSMTALIPGFVVYIVLLTGTFVRPHGKKDWRESRTDSEMTTVAYFVENVTASQIRDNAALRNRYGISDREIDVLVLLLNGRNAATIADTLGISENTARSHLKNLYKKTGVHNRQDLLDLVETTIIGGRTGKREGQAG